jgi:hypothetical protein
MFRNTLLISLFVVSSISLLHGGNGSSRPRKDELSKSEKNNPAVRSPSVENKNILDKYAPYKNEMSSYLIKLEFDNVFTKSDLKNHIETNVNREINDEKKFPLYSALIKKVNETNAREISDVTAALQETTEEFIKSKEIYLIEEKDRISLN